MKIFTVTLYAFHIYQTLSDDPQEVSQDAQDLWNSLVDAGQFLPFEELKTIKSQLICYYPDKDGEFHYNSKEENRLEKEWLTHHQDAINLTAIPTLSGEMSGEIQPFRLYDTYCVDLTLSPEKPDAEFEPQDIARFKPSVLLNTIQANLHKIIVIHVEQRPWKKPNLEQAKEWVNAFCEKAEAGTPEYLDEIKLFNCPAFLFKITGATLIIFLSKPDQLDHQQADDNYSWLRELFWTQAKIEWSYANAKEAYKDARHIYNKLEKKVKDFYSLISQKPEERLTNLDNLLKNLPQNLLDYSCCLRDLKAQYSTIKINHENFQTYLTQLLDSGNKLEIWSKLAKETYPRYLAQTQGYIESIEPGKELFTDLINTIRATAEVEQAKNEKELQDYIQALGFGIGAGAILASASGSITQNWTWPNGQKIESPIPLPHPFLIGFFGSLLVAVVVFDREKHSLKQKRSGQK
ncbi:hypothetical protein [Roseofilum capinflatum]|uniref:Uncharacterized protein n=1 Tax=Roseofilum capinflatum BLCC-M114 TaxID=3022440 RepID=A0ABT7B7Y2_9CYAN|nr:hypothetical protein [Roseofilum capinflatum]MDJ1175288.1 hypothetical protein [Roseofilum capinflatum BLCC-M114]